MSWNNPDSKWQQVLRRRVHLMHMLWVACVGLFVLFAVLALSSTRGSFAVVVPTVVLVAIADVVILVSVWHSIRVIRTVAELVPKHDGHVCRRCRTPLPQEPSQLVCSKCNTAYTRSDIQAYWVDYALNPTELRLTVAKDSWFARQYGPEAPLKKRVLISAVIWFVVVTGVSLSSQLSTSTVAISFLPLLLAIWFSHLFVDSFTAYRRRTGESQHCAQCGYQQAPECERGGRCPECGYDWSGIGGFVVGKATKEARHLWGSVVWFALMIVMFAVFARTSSRGGGWTSRVLPTATLVRDATVSRGSTIEEWRELGRRQLSSEEEQLLAVGLLDKRLRDNYLDKTEGGWLWTQVSASSLPDELIERYYREMLEVWIDAPATAETGKQLSIVLGSNYRYSNQPRGIDAVIYFGGFNVADDPSPIARPDRCMYAGLLDDPRYQMHAEVAPKKPGRLRIRAAMYFAIGPMLPWDKTAVTWHEDGTATLPAAVIWSRRIEIEKSIEVRASGQ